MNLAQQLAAKYKQSRYLYACPVTGLDLYISSMDVKQAREAKKKKAADHQAYVFLCCVYDADGNKAAEKPTDLEELPNILLDIVVAIVNQLSHGANAQTVDRVIKMYMESVNISDEEELELLEAMREEQDKEDEAHSLKNV
jgi:hypothetical protein